MRFRFAAALLAVPASVSAQTVAVEPVLDSIFAPWKSTAGPGCTVGVELDGTRTTRAYGMANLEYRIPLRPESVVESGSVAKQFTAAALVRLAQQGKLSIDDDIRKYLPEVPDFGKVITIRHLLTHTSGLRDQWGLLGLQGFGPGQEVHTLARILDLVAHQKRLNFEPGAEYLYSNTGYALSAIIVERVAGKPLAQYSEDEFFGPLGMTRTEWRADYRKVVPDRATAYEKGPKGWLQDMPFTMVYGNGGLLTTVGDMLIWNDALTKGTIPGGPELVKALETRGRLNDGTEISYALGLAVDTFRGTRSVAHGGSTAGYRTFLARYPEKHLSIAVFCNAAQANAGGYSNQVVARLLDLPGEAGAPGPTVAISEAELQPLAGVYRDSVSDQLATFAIANGVLTASGGGPAAPLTHLGKGHFWSANTGDFWFERLGDQWQVVRKNDGTTRFSPVPKVDPATVKIDDYVGEYRSAELEVTLRLVNRNGALVLELRPSGRMQFRPIYQDGFAAGGRTIRFDRNKAGKVTTLRIFAGRVRDVRFDRI